MNGRLINREEILSQFAEAVKELMQDTARRAVNPGEANITARLSALMTPRFSGWSVDAEYDRNGTLQKMLHYGFDREEEKLRRIRPDIIVHTINTQDNILVVEAKRIENPDRAKDVAKLRGMTGRDEPTLIWSG